MGDLHEAGPLLQETSLRPLGPTYPTSNPDPIETVLEEERTVR